MARYAGINVDLRADGDNNGVIDQGDYNYWQTHYGNVVRGGEIDVTGGSTLNSNGALLVNGQRSSSIDATSTVNVRIWDTTVTPNQFGGTEDIRIGGYGPAYDDFGSQPGLNGNGLVDVKGILNAKDAYVSEHGSTGELRLTGAGKVNLNGTLHMDFCGGCVTDPRPCQTIIESFDYRFRRNIQRRSRPRSLGRRPIAAASRSVGCFHNRDAFLHAGRGGITPIAIAQNIAPEPSGTAYIGGANLVVDLSAYFSSSPLTLIRCSAT